jgi:methyl-accepting chemotaxis protein-2 (aspartate sensor receptor)
MNDWKSLQKEIDEHMEQNTKQVYKMLQMLHEFAKINTRSQLTMLKSFFINRTQIEFDENVTQYIESLNISVPTLRIGNLEINKRFSEVDRFTKLTGSVATVFVRKGNDFVRIATSLLKEDGSRAFLTKLDTNHPAYPLLLDGKNYIGPANLFDKDYMTMYEPIKSDSGEVVGIWFIGYPLSEVLEKFRNAVREIKINESGFIYLMDHAGIMRIHPSLEGKNAIGFGDVTAYNYIKDILSKKNGVIRYKVNDPSKNEQMTKIESFMYFPDWKWVIVSSAYVDEFTKDFAGNFVRSVLMSIAEGIILALVIIWLVYRALTPIRDFVRVTEKMASGDMTEELHYSGNDELGRLAKAINYMRTEIGNLIATLQQEANDVAKRSKNIENLAESVEQHISLQAEDTESAAAAIEEFSLSLKEVSQHMRETADLARELMSNSDEGVATIAKAIERMNIIAHIVQDAAERIRTLEGFSQQISSILDIIRGVADQTNLLALNAAIEAARAGEHGRGFAVVADEVRKLAQSTNRATEEIGEMISKIQNATLDAVNKMDKGVVEVQQGVQNANQAQTAIDQIGKGLSSTTLAVEEVDKALKQQTQAVEAIAQSVDRIANNAEASVESAKVSKEEAKSLQTASLTLQKRSKQFKV